MSEKTDTTDPKITDTAAPKAAAPATPTPTPVPVKKAPEDAKKAHEKAEDYVKNPTAENQEEHRQNLANLPPVPSERAGAASSAK